jgi:hypothetical protein
MNAQPKDAPNAAIALLLHFGGYWRGVGGPHRWAYRLAME